MTKCGQRWAAMNRDGAGYLECTLDAGHPINAGDPLGGHQFGDLVVDEDWFDTRPCGSPVQWSVGHRHRCVLTIGHPGPGGHRCECDEVAA